MSLTVSLLAFSTTFFRAGFVAEVLPGGARFAGVACRRPGSFQVECLQTLCSGLPESGHQQLEPNAGPISATGMSEFGSECSVLSPGDGAVPVETTECRQSAQIV